MARSLVVKVTCGAEDAERCNQGFTVAATAAASGADVSLWLTGEAAWYGVAGRAAEPDLPLATPLDQLLAAVLMIAIQLWTALRFASFVPALVVGIGGTFFSVVATSAKAGVFFPWQMPVNMLATETWRLTTALGLGCGLGLVVLVLAVACLARREVL